MFEHFHAGHHVKTAGLFCRKGFGTDFTVLYPLGLSLKRVQLSHF